VLHTAKIGFGGFFITFACVLYKRQNSNSSYTYLL
jgi:hypothetical protein